ncbi:MAG TPA: hypothetical protein VJZ76_12600 [Thermoanaerobaculia bacterium]|nr:hypothetical protein [Thermoanaerobaculia bacterium]
MKRAIEQLELAARLLEEESNVGLWVSSDDCSDNRRRRQLLREADWAISDAHRCLPDDAAIAALMAKVEPLADLVTEWMGANPWLDLQVMGAREEAEKLAERLRRQC